MGTMARTWGTGDRMMAKNHRGGQIERSQQVISDLDSKQRADLLKYIKKNAQSLFACQHMVKVHKRVPHPKYGDRVPHFETSEAPDPLQCPCAEAQRFRASIGV